MTDILFASFPPSNGGRGLKNDKGCQAPLIVCSMHSAISMVSMPFQYLYSSTRTLNNVIASSYIAKGKC